MKYKVCREPKRPQAASIDLLQAIENRISPSVQDLTDWFAGYAAEHRRRLAFDLDQLRRDLDVNQKVLEGGSVPLLLTGALQEAGFRVQGVDLAPERFQGTIDLLGLDVSKLDIEKQSLPFEDNAFDAIIFNEVFEHLRINPIFTVDELRRVLRIGGVLFLSTPNVCSLAGWMRLMLKGKAGPEIYPAYEKLRTLGHMGHVREYTVIEVCGFLERLGLTIDRIVWRGRFTTSARWKNAVANTITRLVPKFSPFMTVVASKRSSE